MTVSDHSMSLIDENFWIFGGRISIFQYSQKLLKYNTVSNTVQEVEVTGELPSARIQHCSFVHNNLLYIFGGITKNINKQVQETNELFSFNPSTKEWKKVTSTGTIPEPLSGHSCVSYNDKVYIFGGVSEAQPNKKRQLVQKIYALNMKDLVWTETGTMKPRLFQATSLVDGKVYLFGGRDIQGTLNELLVYDLITEKWEEFKVLIPKKQNLCSGVHNTDIYLFGGKQGLSWNNIYNDVHQIRVKPYQISHQDKDLILSVNDELFQIGLLNQQEISISNSKEKIQGFLNKEPEENQKLENLLKKIYSLREVVPLISHVQSLRDSLSREAHGSKGNIEKFDKFYNETVDQKTKMSDVEKKLNEKKNELFTKQALFSEVSGKRKTKDRFLNEEISKLNNLKVSFKEKQVKYEEKKKDKASKEAEYIRLSVEIKKQDTEYLSQAESLKTTKAKLEEAKKNHEKLNNEFNELEKKKNETEKLGEELNQKKTVLEGKLKDLENFKNAKLASKAFYDNMETSMNGIKEFLTTASQVLEIPTKPVQHPVVEDLASIENKFNEKKLKLDAEIDDINKELKDFLKGIKELTEKLEEIKQKKAEEEKVMENHSQLIEATEKKNPDGTSKKNLERLQKEIDDLKKSIREYEASILTDTENLKNLEESLKQKQLEFDTVSEEYKKVEEEVKSKEKELREVRDLSREVRESFRKLKFELTEIKNQIEATKTVFETQDKEYLTAYNTLQTKLDEVTRENTEKDRRIQELESMLKECESKNKEFESKLKESDSKIKELSLKIENLKVNEQPKEQSKVEETKEETKVEEKKEEKIQEQ